MNYLSVSQTAQKWKMTPRRVQVLCSQGRIEGAKKVGNMWTIPETATKPDDARKKLLEMPQKVNTDILIERVWAMPNKNTFDITPIHELIEEELTDGVWIDPFANQNKLASITNDLNENYDTDYHMDALDFMKMFGDSSIDGVLYDPPYSPRQVSECYNDVGYNVTWDTTKASFWGNHKREISRIVKVGGTVITFGWNSGGIGYKYGFEIKRILLVPHGGWHNDTICTVEVKTHEVKTAKKEVAVKGSKEGNDLTDTDKRLIEALSALPENFWDFKETDTREYTHGIHNYPAMMVSPISKNVLSILKNIKQIDSLLDPFCGSGTVLVESMLAGVNTIYGNDMNPFATFLSKVKTTPLDSTILQEEAQQLFYRINASYEDKALQINGVDEVVRSTFELDLTERTGWGSEAPSYLETYCKNCGLSLDIPSFINLGYWFKPRVILMLSLIKEQINKIEDKNIRDFIFIAFSETIRLVSNRRNGEFKMFRMPPKKVDAFEPDVIAEFTLVLNRNIKKMNDFTDACSECGNEPSIHITTSDAASLSGIPDNSIDVVITSPPYGDSRTTVAYGEYSRLSMQWINLNLSEKEIMGVDKSLLGGSKFRNGFEYNIKSVTLKDSLYKIKDENIERAGDVYSFYLDLSKAIEEISKKTKNDGYQFWVVGNRTVKGELLQTDKIIAEIAEHFSMQYVYSIDRNIINKVMPSQNSPTNETGKKASTMTNEHIVILKKIK